MESKLRIKALLIAVLIIIGIFLIVAGLFFGSMWYSNYSYLRSLQDDSIQNLRIKNGDRHTVAIYVNDIKVGELDYLEDGYFDISNVTPLQDPASGYKVEAKINSGDTIYSFIGSKQEFKYRRWQLTIPP